MKLREYLKEINISGTKLAVALGVHQNWIYNIMRGKAVPSYELACRIEEWSGGKVTVKDVKPPKAERVCCETCGQPIRFKK